MTLFNRHILAALVAAMWSAPNVALADNVTVVELFTSQGCSSCPPADSLLGELAERDDLVALSLPVDYWDYLGWKDSFGSPKHSARQKSYALTRGDRAVYTPQVVINGERHVVGSDRRELKAALAAAAGNAIDVGLEVNERTIDITLPDASGERRRGTIWLAGFSSAEPVEIGRGENAGRTVTYHNVVRKLIRVGEWNGEALSLSVKRSDIWADKMSGCAVIVQEDRYGGIGPVLGAALVVE